MELSFATVTRAVLNEPFFFERATAEKPKENRCQAPVFRMYKKTNAITRKNVPIYFSRFATIKIQTKKKPRNNNPGLFSFKSGL
jgi:hypothetical protein